MVEHILYVYIRVFLHFFPRSSVFYPSFLTHIVVGTCLHDRCCVHPPERDLSDFGRKKVFSRIPLYTAEFTKVQITSYFIRVQQLHNNIYRYTAATVFQNHYVTIENWIVSVNNNNFWSKRLRLFLQRQFIGFYASHITHKCIMYDNIIIMYLLSVFDIVYIMVFTLDSPVYAHCYAI